MLFVSGGEAGKNFIQFSVFRCVAWLKAVLRLDLSGSVTLNAMQDIDLGSPAPMTEEQLELPFPRPPISRWRKALNFYTRRFYRGFVVSLGIAGAVMVSALITGAIVLLMDLVGQMVTHNSPHESLSNTATLIVFVLVLIPSLGHVLWLNGDNIDEER